MNGVWTFGRQDVWATDVWATNFFGDDHVGDTGWIWATEIGRLGDSRRDV